MTPEFRLALACARLVPVDAQILQLASGPMEWAAATRLAIRHGLGPLMHHHLSRLGIPLPKAPAAALWARAESVARRNRERAVELVSIARGLQAAGIRFVPFKGPLLGARVYSNVSLREFNDLDLLVAPADVRAALRVLATRGYAPRTRLDAVREELWLRSAACYELPLANERGELVELQWRANPDVPVPAVHDPDWWESASAVRFEGIDLCVMAPQEEMLALLVHGSKHRWASMDWLVDVAELARRSDVAWDAVIALARHHHAGRRVALGMRLAHELLEAPLPSAAQRFTQEARVDAMAARIVPGLCAADYVAPTPTDVIGWELAQRDSWPRRLAWLATLSRPTSGDWQWVRLPGAFTFLYRALRPLRLALKYLRARPPRSPAAARPRTPPPRPHSTS